MLGRRKSRSSPEAVDITERIRRRTLGGNAFGEGVPANSGNRFARPQPARSAPPRPGAKSAELLSFDDTPDYRVQATASVPRDILYLALAVLTDRLEATGSVVGPRQELGRRISDLIGEVLDDLGVRLTLPEQSELTERLLDELIGFGPLGVLLADETVGDIMVDGPDAVYVERRGRIQATDVAFRGPAHLSAVLERIAAAGGRRLDEQQPFADIPISDRLWAHMVVPPMAVDGPRMTLRKDARRPVTLARMVSQASLSADMAAVLEVAVRCRLNIVIVGGSGSGKTTLLDAISRTIDPDERIVTIEDTAELRLPQAHVLRLESRPLNGISAGEVSRGQLLRTALRMRPDRVIVGQVQGSEALELIMAMSSGRDGMLSTLHAGSARDALGRLEVLICAGEPGVPMRCCRAQVADAVDLIVLVERSGDGLRRLTRITEVVGLKADTIATRELFTFDHAGEDENGRVLGSFKFAGLSPRFMDRVRDHGLERRLRDALGLRASTTGGEGRGGYGR